MHTFNFSWNTFITLLNSFIPMCILFMPSTATLQKINWLFKMLRRCFCMPKCFYLKYNICLHIQFITFRFKCESLQFHRKKFRFHLKFRFWDGYILLFFSLEPIFQNSQSADKFEQKSKNIQYKQFQKIVKVNRMYVIMLAKEKKMKRPNAIIDQRKNNSVITMCACNLRKIPLIICDP